MIHDGPTETGRAVFHGLCECGCGRPKKANRRGKRPRWFSDACRKRHGKHLMAERHRRSRESFNLGNMTVAERRALFLEVAAAVITGPPLAAE